MATLARDTEGSSSSFTVGTDLSVASVSTAAASISATLYLSWVLSQAMMTYANELVSYFDIQMQDAKNSADETKKAATQQMWGSIIQGGAQIAQGGFSIAGGVAGSNESKEIDDNIKNATEFREATDNNPNVKLTDAQIQGCHTEEQTTQIEKMQNSEFDFGKEKVEDYSDAMNNATKEETQTIRENVNDYIKRQQAQQSQPNAKAQIYQGIGTVVVGAGQIGNGIFSNAAASHTAQAKIEDAKQTAASTMMNNAQQQWNSIVSNLTQLYQLIIQIAEANRVSS